jgi:hypothetical protein
MRCQGCGEEHETTGRYCPTCTTVEVFRGHTRASLKDAFELVAPKGNWKNPISTFLPGDMCLVDRERIDAAVVFYAGCTAAFVRRGTGLLVTAPGYYASVGA